jgi:glycosyltransferase involved in cell wall biosynthesis
MKGGHGGGRSGAERDRAPLRVLSFTTLFPNPAEPGRGIFVRNRLAEIASRADLLVIAPVNAGRNPRVLGVPFRRRDPAGFDVLHPRFAVLPGMLKQWDAAFLFGETWPQVRGAIRNGGARPDLVDGHYAFPDGAAGARLARHLGVPFVLSVRGSDLEVIARNGARREPIRRTLRDAGAVIAVSRSLERRALELGAVAARTHVIPNGVDVARFLPLDRAAARDALRIPRDERMVLVVARLEPVKGLDLLSAAMAALRARAVDARAHVVGEGPGRRAVEEAIRASAVEDAMRLHGSRPAETLPLWYAASDVVCLLSHSEGCPNVILEALACGRPVVATDVGGIPDLVRDGENGFLVRSRDPGEVADRLEAALSRRWDPAAIAAAARRSWGRVAEEQMEIYRRVVGCP